MKVKSKKIQCALLALMMVFVCATSVFAAPAPYEHEECGDDHIHGDNFIIQSENYVCTHNYHGADYDCKNQIPQITSSFLQTTYTEEHIFISAEELAIFMAEYAEGAIFISSLENSAYFISEAAGEVIERQSSEHSCYFQMKCVGDHRDVGLGGCQRRCYTWATCICGNTTYMYGDIVYEHPSWSIGWCGQTCTACGTVEIFHAPGGCWFCAKYGYSRRKLFPSFHA